MTQKQITFDQLRLGEKVTLKLREGESVIVGKVTEKPTAGGNARVTLTNNANSVVLTPSTNFRIFADRGPTLGEKLNGLPLGAVFKYKNKYGVTKTWIKTGDDRVTLADSTRPAYSLSISAGFPSGDDFDATKYTFVR